MIIYESLKKKFSENFDRAISFNKDKLEEAEIKSRILFSFGSILNNDSKSKTEREISEIYNEIFSDIAISIYLSISSIDHASKILLRRAFELGFATIYFWDLPHQYWGWKKNESYETDLNFKEIIDYFSSLSYQEYLTNEFEIKNWFIDKSKINKLYRELSNVVHCKYISFETITEKSYEFVENEYESLLDRIIACENILINCNKTRFFKQYLILKDRMPSIERYNYEY